MADAVPLTDEELAALNKPADEAPFTDGIAKGLEGLAGALANASELTAKTNLPGLTKKLQGAAVLGVLAGRQLVEVEKKTRGLFQSLFDAGLLMDDPPKEP